MSQAEGRRPVREEEGRKTPSRERQDDHREEALDEALEESFPASDPPSPTRPAEHSDKAPKER